MADIKLKHVYKRFEDGVAVKDLSLDIKDKEFVIFVGPSGCGKSTTLRMIAGLESVSDGELYIDDVLVNNVKPYDRDVAMVFQNYALYPHMTVAENITYSLKLQKVSKKERRNRAQEVAQILELEAVLDRLPKQLSGGQKQRVAMGRAIVRNPKVFLMDEPLSNLDAKLRNQMRGEILKLYHRLNTTFVYVTHDQVEAMTLGTKIVVLKDGEIQQAATAEILYNKPENVFVAGFIGTPPMNFFEGKCIKKEQQLFLRMGSVELPLSNEWAEEVEANHYLGEEVIVGVRPEDIIVSDEGVFQSKVRIYELLGAESYLHFEHDNVQACARVSAHTPYKKDSVLPFTFDMEKIHLFDKYKKNRI